MKYITGLAFAASLTLAACGGGGGGSSSEPAATAGTYAIAAAERNWLRTGKTYQFQRSLASSPGMFMADVLIVRPLDPVQLPALSASTAERTSIYGTSTLSGNAAPESIYRSVEYYQDAPLRYLGSSVYEDSAVIPAEQAAVMPETATVGASGSLYTLPAVSNADLTFQDSLSWSLEADTLQTAWLCHHYETRQTPVAGGTSRVEDRRVCLKIDLAGNVSDFKSDDVTI